MQPQARLLSLWRRVQLRRFIDARLRRGFLIAMAALVLASALPAGHSAAQGDGSDHPVLYLFWGDGCPHCAAEKTFLAELAARHPTLKIHDYEVWNNQANQRVMWRMAESFGFEPEAVPTTFLGDRYWVGYSEQIGQQIEQAVAQCMASGCRDAGAGIVAPPALATPPAFVGPVAEAAPVAGSAAPTAISAPHPAAAAAANTVSVPFLGVISLQGQSLLLSTALIAFVDGFNPCSLWALTVLLAITLHTGSRRKVALIGLVYITVTALIYALFIAGLFTAFTFVNISGWLRVIVAGVALVFAAINIKDYFFFKQGASLTISDAQKPGLYRKMRALADPNRSTASLIGGTIVLAAGVSLVEFSCTAGFPMLWTNLLTAQGVGALGFLALLGVYLLIYQLDELLIFFGAVATMKAARLDEKHGRVLKLASGMLMLALAIVMLIDPSWMNSLGNALLVFAAAALATLAVIVVVQVVLPRMGLRIGAGKKRPDRLKQSRR